MRKAWDKLGVEWDADDLVNVGEVDCSRFVLDEETMTSTDTLCHRYDIERYPTVLVFNGATGQQGMNYTGGVSFEEMDTFLRTERAKFCLVAPETFAPSETCDEDERAFIGQWAAKGHAAANAELVRLEKISGQREVTFGASKRRWMGQRINILKQIRANAARALKQEL